MIRWSRDTDRWALPGKETHHRYLFEWSARNQKSAKANGYLLPQSVGAADRALFLSRRRRPKPTTLTCKAISAPRTSAHSCASLLTPFSKSVEKNDFLCAPSAFSASR